MRNRKSSITHVTMARILSSMCVFAYVIVTSYPPTVVAASLDECLRAELPLDTNEWNLNDPVVEVVWNIDRVCANVSQCFGRNGSSSPPPPAAAAASSVEFVRDNQLPPVALRPDQMVIFRSPGSIAGQAPVILDFFEVDEAGFEDCFAVDLERLDSENDTLLGVANGKLLLGNNYFIANNANRTVSFWQCFPYGLRVNITVQPKNCSSSSSAQDAELCNGRGRCEAARYEPSYRCRCCAGYLGDYCGRIDGCYDVKCQHGATCFDGPDDGSAPPFTCHCIRGFTGTFCENLAGEQCTTNECMNMGICLKANTTLTFVCLCPDGFTGKVCETNIDDCLLSDCGNGDCQDLVNGYKCNCYPDYTGAACETFTGPCPAGRCLNDGTCLTLANNTALCYCHPGYTGPSCETKVDICTESLCQNAIDCIDYGYGFRCICNPGYSGDHCELNVDECASNPCLNGGTCIDRVAGFSCECTEGFPPPICYNATKTEEERKKNAGDNSSWLMIVVAVLAALVGILLIVLLAYCCFVHKVYKQFRLRNKYAHVVDETYGPSRGVSSSDVTGDVGGGAHPSPDFVADSSSGEVLVKSPLVRRVKNKESIRI